MRILLTTNYLPPYEGGIQFVVDQLARGYVDAGHQVTVAGYDPAQAKRGVVPYDVVSLPAWNPLERLSIPIPIYEPITLLREMWRLVAEVDVVHGHGLLYPNVVLTVVLAARAGKPVVVTEHVGLVASGRRWLDRLQASALSLAARLVGRRTRAVVVLNDRVRLELERLLPVTVPLVRIDNGVDGQRFRPAERHERQALREKWHLDRPAALFVGRLARKKGADLVLDAARATDRFDVVVCGKDTERLERVPDNVQIVGLVDQDDLAELYQAADVLVLPSEGEGFPLVIQEALASGMPVVVAHGTVAPDDHGATTVQFAERTPTDIVRAVHDLLDRDDLPELAATGRTVALEAFDWSAAVERYLDLFDDTP